MITELSLSQYINPGLGHACLYGTNGPAMLCTSWMCVICVYKLKDYIKWSKPEHGIKWREKIASQIAMPAKSPLPPRSPGPPSWHMVDILIPTSCSFLAIRLCSDRQNSSSYHRIKNPKTRVSIYIRWDLSKPWLKFGLGLTSWATARFNTTRKLLADWLWGKRVKTIFFVKFSIF